MYSKIKSIVSEFVGEHDLHSKAKMELDFLVDALTVRLFDGLNQKEQQLKPQRKPAPKSEKEKPSILNIAQEVAK